MDYWKECVAEAFDDAGITATDDQIGNVAGWIEGAHETYGMAFGHDCIPNPQTLEIDKLQRELKTERDKVICEECGGRGHIIENFFDRCSISSCDRCRGEGRHV